MRPWIKRTLIGLFGASVLFGGLAACSHQRGPGGWAAMSEADSAKLREKMIDRVSGELKLDEAQKARLGALADALRAQRQALMADGRPPRDELQALVAGEKFDRSKAQALIDAKTGAVRDKAPAVVAAAADFYDSLRPEQQQKVREFMERGRGHRGWRS